jgi:hypothetical protein
MVATGVSSKIDAKRIERENYGVAGTSFNERL